MKYPIHISKQKSQFVAKDDQQSLVARGETLHELIQNLEFMLEQLEPDPDEGLELTAKAKRRFAAAKRMMDQGNYKTYSLEEIKKKYNL